ncbi:hypothetical protein ACWGCC_37880 [Streptomyces nigrescens]
MRHLSSAYECGGCCRIWAVLDDRHAKGEKITPAELSAAVELALSTTRVHLTVLVREGHVDVDRRTPLVRCGTRPRPLPESPTPGRWAASLTIECRTCRRIVTVIAELAGPDWTTRSLAQAELAHHVGVTPKTLLRHLREHLSELVQREPSPRPRVEVRGRWRYVGSAPDRYVLLTGLGPREPDWELLGRSDSWLVDAGHQLLDDVPWFRGVEPSDREAAAVRIAGHLRDGYPYAVLEEMVLRRPVREPVISPYALLISLLPPPGGQYIPTAAETVGAAPAGRSLCPTCEHPHDDPAVPAGVICGPCTRAATPAF